MERADQGEACGHLIVTVLRCQLDRKTSPTQRENHVHSRLHIDGLAVQQIRTIAPLAHRVERRLLQHGRAADDAKIDDRSILGDCGCQNYGSLHVCSFGQRRIGRNDLADQQARGNGGWNVGRPLGHNGDNPRRRLMP